MIHAPFVSKTDFQVSEKNAKKREALSQIFYINKNKPGMNDVKVFVLVFLNI